MLVFQKILAVRSRLYEGDSVTINAILLLIQLNVDEAEIATRKAVWKAPGPRYTRGLLGKFFKLAGTASKGAVTDKAPR